MKAALLKKYLSVCKVEGDGVRFSTSQPTAGKPMDMVTYILPLVPPTSKDQGPCRQTQTDEDEVIIVPMVQKTEQESTPAQPFEAEIVFVEPEPVQGAASIQEELDRVFLRYRSHYLRNPAPLLDKEALDLNFQGRLTIEQESQLRASLP